MAMMEKCQGVAETGGGNVREINMFRGEKSYTHGTGHLVRLTDRTRMTR